MHDVVTHHTLNNIHLSLTSLHDKRSSFLSFFFPRRNLQQERKINKKNSLMADYAKRREKQAAAALYRSLVYREDLQHDCPKPNYLSRMGQSVEAGIALEREQCRDRDTLYVTRNGFGCCQPQKGTKRVEREEDVMNDEEEEDEWDIYRRGNEASAFPNSKRARHVEPEPEPEPPRPAPIVPIRRRVPKRTAREDAMNEDEHEKEPVSKRQRG
jgi:hypothetical protein